MPKKHRHNNKMKGNLNMDSEELDIVAETPAEVVAPISEPAVAPAAEPAAVPVADNSDKQVVAVDLFGTKRHISIPNVK
jgi:hypothetical protein